MSEILTGVAAIIGAVGTIISVYLAYKIRVVTHNTDGNLRELREENLALGEQVTSLVGDRAKNQ